MILRDTKIPIVEIFNSIQGEVNLNPAIFIRSGLCCFTCKGFGCSLEAPDGTVVEGCDTIRAVSPKFKENWKYYSNFKDLTNEVNKHIVVNGNKITEQKQDIIWTGGEPTIHWNTKVMQDTLSYYISRGHNITIETNGSLDFEFFREYQKKITFSISVKLSNSGELKERRFNTEMVTKIIENCPSSYLKFVINPETYENDIEEIYEFLDDIPAYIKVYFMPQGATQSELQKNTRFVIEKCIENNFSFTDRAHIRAWNDKEGV